MSVFAVIQSTNIKNSRDILEQVVCKFKRTNNIRCGGTELLCSNTLQPATGCEHVSLDDVLPGISTKEKSYRREQQRNDKKLIPGQRVPDFTLVNLDGEEMSLSEILEDNDTVLILGVVGLVSFALILSSCAQNTTLQPATGCEHVSLDDVLPGITTKEKSYRREQQRNDKQLVPGQRVPDFTLANRDGEQVNLSHVLGENDAVLIDFWASWCGPCIASFPKLMELRAAYKHEGFEIVSISIDRTREDWLESSDEHELPWIDLGELESWHGEVATMYGVHFIPKSYLIDSEGCIVHKDLPTTLLEDVLTSELGEVTVEDTSSATDS